MLPSQGKGPTLLSAAACEAHILRAGSLVPDAEPAPLLCQGAGKVQGLPSLELQPMEWAGLALYSHALRASSPVLTSPAPPPQGQFYCAAQAKVQSPLFQVL